MKRKRITALLLMSVLVFSLVACGKDSAGKEGDKAPKESIKSSS